MRILILADRRIGHVRQCLGLVRLIERDHPVETVELQVRPHKFATDWVRRLTAGMPGLSAAFLLKRSFGLTVSDIAGFDLVIGSGRTTILAGVLIRRLSGARFIYCGRTPGYDAQDFDLVLTPYQGEDLPHHVHAPIPSPIDPTVYPSPRPLISVEALDGAAVTLLVGGPSSRRGWSMLDWGHLANFIVEAEHQLGVKWSISTSPRTPDAARGLLAAAFSALEHGGEYVDFHVAGPGSADHLLGADAICVTSDSTSMIAEGLGAMRPVIGILSRRLKSSRDDRHLNDLAASGSFTDLVLTGLTPGQFATALTGLVRPDRDPRDSLRAALSTVLRGIA